MALLFLGGACFVHAQQAVTLVPEEPANLDPIKQRLRDYQSCRESNCYAPQLDRQAQVATAFLKQSIASARPGDKLAIVLDVDETSLSNWAIEAHDDFAYVPSDYNICATLRCAKAIPGTLRLFATARANGVAVFFITGRPETQRADTEANLQMEGYDGWQYLYLRPVDHPQQQTVTEYKSGDRQKIVDGGYRIVLNVGDQLSDLKGQPQADHSVKLPNPFYLIP